MNFFQKLFKTFLLAVLFVLFLASIIYWKIAKRLKPSKKMEYQAKEVGCLFCGLVPTMTEFDKTWNVNFFGKP